MDRSHTHDVMYARTDMHEYKENANIHTENKNKQSESRQRNVNTQEQSSRCLKKSGGRNITQTKQLQRYAKLSYIITG